MVFFTPGESEAAPYTGYLTDRAITGAIAKAIGGAVVMVERMELVTDTLAEPRRLMIRRP